MDRLAPHASSRRSPEFRRRWMRLRDERRKLSARLSRVDAQLSKLEARHAARSIPTPAQLDKWLGEITAGLPALPPLPADFSRSDLYDDHD